MYMCVDVIISLKSGYPLTDSSTNGVNVDTSLNSLNLAPNNLSNSSAVVPSTAPDRYSVPLIFSKLSPGQFGPKGIMYIC